MTTETDTIQASYDRVPYISHSYLETHPRILESFAYLFGLTPPPCDASRILELGCGAGGNLLPIAYSLPASTCVGIDLSPVQVEDAKRLAAAVPVPNVRFEARSIADVDDDFGRFDYIVCHGVYSWVPAEVQDKILSICKRNLSEDGVAMVSFNTYPGWFIKEWVRELMLYHVKDVKDDKQKIAEALEFLKYCTESPMAASVPATPLLKRELQQMGDKDQSYILHEYLEEHNQPLYFEDFMKRARPHGLDYLADARYNGIILEQNSPMFRKIVERTGGDLVRIEQYADLISNRVFRRALLVHQGQPVRRDVAMNRLREMSVVTFCRPEQDRTACFTNLAMRFVQPRGASFTTAVPYVKLAMFTLFELSPRAVPFAELCDRVERELKVAEADGPKMRDALARELVQYMTMSLIQLYRTGPAFADDLPARPVASALARHQAAAGVRMVTNLRHEMVNLQGDTPGLLARLDGARTADELAAEYPKAKPGQIMELLRWFLKNSLIHQS